LSLNSTPYSEENIYDLAIRLYGNINGLTGIIPSLDSIDSDVIASITYEPIEFVDYVEPEQPNVDKPDLSYKIGEGQSIYDLATQLTGKLQGLEDIIQNYSSLDEDLQGVTIEVPRKSDILVDIFLSNDNIFATKTSEAVLTGWILETGIWDDLGIWIDGEIWID